MAQYTIKYLDGESETVTAVRAEYNTDTRQFVFHGDNGPVALIPQANVRSVVQPDDEAVTG